MTRVAVIRQPEFAPYLGFFHRFLHADLYVVLDHVPFVQHTSRAWTHRDKIKTPQGERWLTISVGKTPLNTPINAVKLSAAHDWRTDNLRLLEANYRKAPFFRTIFPEVARLYGEPTEHLSAFNLRFIEWLMDALGVRIPHVRSSELEPVGTKNELLVDILKKVRADVYISGKGALDYFDPSPFDEAGIAVRWHQFAHPIYPQLHGAFIPNLSSLDMLFNCGIEDSARILRAAK